jgi:hypothetical protein
VQPTDGRFPSQAMALNKAWLAAALIAATLLAWLRLPPAGSITQVRPTFSAPRLPRQISRRAV